MIVKLLLNLLFDICSSRIGHLEPEIETMHQSPFLVIYCQSSLQLQVIYQYF